MTAFSLSLLFLLATLALALVVALKNKRHGHPQLSIEILPDNNVTGTTIQHLMQRFGCSAQ